ncbi:MAG: cytidine deaminase [Bdellovibrionales bacterium]|nr:cytidine deaminase [Bdellovibrionales bacterium]
MSRTVSEQNIKEMIKRATDVRSHAYNPYYKTYVGACVMDDQGNFFEGCNVGNGVGLLDSCAEAIALGHARAKGSYTIEAIAIVGFEHELITPCGACRQRLAELAPGAKIICANIQGDYKLYSLDELLPHRYECK